jgi:hypothetical protein
VVHRHGCKQALPDELRYTVLRRPAREVQGVLDVRGRDEAVFEGNEDGCQRVARWQEGVRRHAWVLSLQRTTPAARRLPLVVESRFGG